MSFSTLGWNENSGPPSEGLPLGQDGNWNAQSLKIESVHDPAVSSDCSTKNYCDTTKASLSGNNTYTGTNTFNSAVDISAAETTTGTISSTYTNTLNGTSMSTNLNEYGFNVNGNNFSSATLNNTFSVQGSSATGGNIFQMRQTTYNSSTGEGVLSMRMGGTQSHSSNATGLTYGDFEVAFYGANSSFSSDAACCTGVGGYPGIIQGDSPDCALRINPTSIGSSKLGCFSFYSNNNGGYKKYYQVNLNNTNTANSEADLDIFDVVNSASRITILSSNGNVGINQPNPAYSLDCGSNINCAGNLYLNNTIMYNTPSSTYTGTSSGNFYLNQIYSGANYKKVIVILYAYFNNTATSQTANYWHAFTTVNFITKNTTGLGFTTTLTTISLPTAMSTSTSGIIEIEGF